ncbi:SIS domain-containing protein [Sutcliffiella sp. BMC8]|uniref:SIS domain-containing protein n=1 Tax=unclassified Sutcliffiella TaxID=2837532 RepID=UPI0034C5B67D
MLHVFGCGHSHMLAEEVFYRAGGIVPIRPLFVEDLMLHKGALRSSDLEKDPLFAKTFLPSQPFQPNDVLLVVSTSG